MDEVWCVIEEASDYEVSTCGRVRRSTPDWQGKYLGRILKPGFTRGYAKVTLCVDGVRLNRSIHVLVCQAFNGPKPAPGMHAAHRDGDKTNNTPGNVYWATPAQNCADRERHGRTHRGPRTLEAIANLPRGAEHWSHRHPERVRRGETHWRSGTVGTGAKGEAMAASKLTESQVREILAHPKTFGSGRLLAERYAVSMALITSIRKGRAWAHVRASDTV